MYSPCLVLFFFSFWFVSLLHFARNYMMFLCAFVCGKLHRAIIRKCNNALHPDSYGHYREAKFTQTKHHWWWKANRVFDQLDVTRHHTGLVLFLEEDHYVAEDFLYLLALMQKRAAELCTKCNILSLGTYLKTFNYYTYSNNNKVRDF